MNATLAQQSKPFALQLHAFLKELDAPLSEPDQRERLLKLEAQLASLLSAPSAAAPKTLKASLAHLLDLLREGVPAREDAYARFRKQLNRGYEALCRALERHAVQLPEVRPSNYVRSAFHLGIAVMCILLLQYALTPTTKWLIPVSLAVSFWCGEVLRHFSPAFNRFMLSLFRLIVHPHESVRLRVNSSTWFGSAVAILGAFFDIRACVAALAVLGVADPAAAIIGRRWGRTKLVGQRSLEGSIAFVLTGTLAATLCLSIWHPGPLSNALLIGLAAALPAAVVELFSGRFLDDNLSIPVTAALGATIAMLVL